MSWKTDFEHAMNEAPFQKVKWWDGWERTWHGMSKWKGPKGRPVALMLHHTAGASTTSKDLDHNGNQCSADNGQASFVARHPSFNSPASQFLIRRCGQLDIYAYLPCYHAGSGKFTSKPWTQFNIPTDSFNSYGMGVEIVSKGQKDDLTAAQWNTLGELYAALGNICHWEKWDQGWVRKYTPRHKDWTSRKIDIQASRDKTETKISEQIQLWDGKVPDFLALVKAHHDPSLKSAAAHRMAQRLHDLKYYKTDVLPRYEQGFPMKAWENYLRDRSPGMFEDGGPGNIYGHKSHDAVWLLPKGTTNPDGSVNEQDHHEQ